jgi:hypothetical protein
MCATFFALPANAATTAFITWQTPTVVPAGYFGKILPNRTAPISAAVFATDNDFVVPLNKSLIKWYVNDEFLKSGVGLTNISIPAENPPLSTVTIRATIKNGEASTSDTTTSVSIPRTYPIIALTHPPQRLQRSERLMIRAIPYFFSPSDDSPLQYRWRVDGRIRSLADEMLVLDTSSSGIGQSVQVFADATHPKNIVETTSAELTLKIP